MGLDIRLPVRSPSRRETHPLDSLIATFRTLGVVRLALVGTAVAALLGFLAFVSGFGPATKDHMALLYADLAPKDAAEIVERLDATATPYVLSPDGTRISVPSQAVARLRMTMARDGLPRGGSVGYEIFDQSAPMGTSTFVQQVNQLRALEGELARTVSALGPILGARIHIVMPRREAFSRAENPPSASVFVRLRPNDALTREQIKSNQHIVAAAIPRLQAGAVSVVDDRGKLLARGGGSDDAGGGPSGETEDERRRSFEHRVARDIEDMLGQTIGYGRVRAQVTADLDLDRVTINEEKFDPEGQVLRSNTVREGRDTSTDADRQADVSVENNLPGRANGPQPAGRSSTNASQNSEEVNNYEINRTVRTVTRATGQVRRLSVAVMVDGVYESKGDGASAFRPRTADELAGIERLVKRAIGFDQQRGDAVEVASMQFLTEAEIPVTNPSAQPLLGFDKQDVMSIVEMVLIALFGVFLVFFVVRPLLLRGRERAAANASANEAELARADPLSGDAAAAAADIGTVANALDDEIDKMITLQKIDGKIRSSTMRNINELVRRNPNETVSLLRTWLQQS